MYYQNLFNQNYINEQYYCELLKQRNQIEQQIKFEQEQEAEIGKMLKALNDFLDSFQKIAPQYQKRASELCLWEICRRIYNEK